MLSKLTLENTGPVEAPVLAFGRRLNVFTGDNGLGKTFLLDAAWYALTRKWPGDVNPAVLSGRTARPTDPAKPARIVFSLLTSAGKTVEDYVATFDRAEQTWTGRVGRPYSAGLVVYAHADGGFSVWDQARNYWRKKGSVDVQDRPSAFVFAPGDVWNGLSSGDKVLCNGLLRDWILWQMDKDGKEFPILSEVLSGVSPPEFAIEPGPPMRISIDDIRDVPSIKMPYGTVPLPHVSAGIRRIAALAYILVWAFSEHIKASGVLGQAPSSQITLLFDEVEAHLHPKWQRVFLGGLMKAIRGMQTDRRWFVESNSPSVQLLVATHSPLFMASLEDVFDPGTDRWFDLDYEPGTGKALLEERPFVPQGTADSWLAGEAFDLSSSRSVETEKLLERAAAMQESPDATPDGIRSMYRELREKLPPFDAEPDRFRALAEAKGVSVE